MAVGEVVHEEVLVLEGGAEAVVGVRQPRCEIQGGVSPFNDSNTKFNNTPYFST